MQEPNTTEFTIKYHHRHDLRKWLRDNFDFVESTPSRNYSPEHLNILKSRANDILDACEQVESIDLRVKSAYVDYYKMDWQNIRDACNNKDFKKLGGSLADLLTAIDWE